MNQNVFGVILFGFIVGTAIFVSGFFATIPAPRAVYEKPVTYTNKESCRRQNRTFVNQTTPVGTANIKVVQAVLNQQTNQLETEYIIKRENSQSEVVGISLHFFAKDGSKTRYIATQTVTVSPDFDEVGKANHPVTSSYQWLDDLQRRDNLYVIAESSLNFNKSKDLEPKFDETKATPVLLDKGR